jgi:hypothetical protein
VAKYCCFVDPKGDYAEKTLDDPCPICGRTYRFPLSDAPSQIGQFQITRALGRGFYASTYVAERRGVVTRRSVLKVSPVSFYDFFPGKDFAEECRLHQHAAEGAEHIVGLEDAFQAEVDFGGTRLQCNITELRFVEGELLSKYLDPGTPLSAITAAQIAIDLMRIRMELERREINHNDLHADNVVIARLTSGTRRADALDPMIRAVAIDLGSAAEESKSSGSRVGDLHWIERHLQRLVDKLMRDVDRLSDLEYRIAAVLQTITHELRATPENQRTPEPSDYIRSIEEEFRRTGQPWRPWRDHFQLRTFDASYNAQTLESWHVPKLLVDPDGLWLQRISAPGPQIITGMRGCGKTLLLRAAQFHARAVAVPEEGTAATISRLADEGYLGLFVSAQRLLDSKEAQGVDIKRLFARLFVAYALDLAHAVAHVADISSDKVSKFSHREIIECVRANLDPNPDIGGALTIEELERSLGMLLVLLSRNDSPFALASHPNAAFTSLADAARRCSEVWRDSQILFLLDDVSTRYLTPERVRELMSALIFQSSICAFKITSEAQTMHLTVPSPGGIHPARVGRDLDEFDLGAEVYSRLKRSGQNHGKDFVERILAQRARHWPAHPQSGPREILGDEQLERIAENIARSRSSSAQRKRVYHGLTALANVCVGDIGDVINLYEQIVGQRGDVLPVQAEIQSNAFQALCSKKIYALNRRGGRLKDTAKSFAEASHELLLQSVRAGKGSKRPRIRQYSSIYVRITAGDIERQTDQLRELVDAGVFVFAGGSSTPRTKTRDADPIQQFKLTFRKIYGLVSYIGLGERDRFELSGDDLQEWLDHPERGKEILIRNHVEDDGEEDGRVETIAETPGAGDDGLAGEAPSRVGQMTLFGVLSPQPAGRPVYPEILPLPTIGVVSETDIGRAGIVSIVAGLGFEERTEISVRRVAEACGARDILLIRYPALGRSKGIKKIADELRIRKVTIDYARFEEDWVLPAGAAIVDVTGLAKPVIFHAVRGELLRNRLVYVAYTAADQYYPREEDISKVLEAEKSDDHHRLLEALRDVLTGEEGPYSCRALLPQSADETRGRGLCAFSSAKQERLLSLLDGRDYDAVDILVNEADRPRSRVALIAAEVANQNNRNTSVTVCPSEDAEALLNALAARYQDWYVKRGLNFELGLTGNKMQAVAAAALSASVKVNQCWYVSPARFDSERFTIGVGETRFIRIGFPDSGSEGHSAKSRAVTLRPRRGAKK